MQQQLTAMDGSVVNTIVRVARLSWTPKGKTASVSAYRLDTGCRPNVAVFEAICFYLMGWASLEELEARIAKHSLPA